MSDPTPRKVDKEVYAMRDGRGRKRSKVGGCIAGKCGIEGWNGYRPCLGDCGGLTANERRWCTKCLNKGIDK